MLLVFVLPLAGGGIYLMSRPAGGQRVCGSRQAEEDPEHGAGAGQQLSDVALELNTPVDNVEDMVHDLVGKNLFSGDQLGGRHPVFQAGVAMADRKCPNCGGQVELVGKGVIKCPFCGSEVFLGMKRRLAWGGCILRCGCGLGESSLLGRKYR